MPRYDAKAFSDRHMLVAKWLRIASVQCPSNMVGGEYPRLGVDLVVRGLEAL
jgi:hypothetical protein